MKYLSRNSKQIISRVIIVLFIKICLPPNPVELSIIIYDNSIFRYLAI